MAILPNRQAPYLPGCVWENWNQWQFSGLGYQSHVLPWVGTQQKGIGCFSCSQKDSGFPSGRCSCIVLIRMKQLWGEVMGQVRGNRAIKIPFLFLFPLFLNKLFFKNTLVAWCFRIKNIINTCLSVFTPLAFASHRGRWKKSYWDRGTGTRKINSKPSLSPPLNRSKNDCAGREGFMSAVSPSECRGKSRLTFLASGKKSNCILCLHFAQLIKVRKRQSAWGNLSTFYYLGWVWFSP